MQPFFHTATSGDEVNVTTLLSVLEGNKEAVQSLGTGKVGDPFLFITIL